MSATSLFRLAARSRVQPEQSSRGKVGGGGREGRGGVEGMGGDHASLRFGDVTCCVVSGQALLRFLEARRRVLYVNEYNTSQFCHVCDQRVRQVSNRQVSLSTHPLARLLPHTLLQLEMQAAAASMTVKPPPRTCALALLAGRRCATTATPTFPSTGT